jgi:HSP20 family protein
MPFGPWSYADVEEMMKEMEKDFMSLDIEKDVPKELIRERREQDGTTSKEIGPIVYGYSVTLGPDGKPVVHEFGNVKRGPTKQWKEAVTGTREPLVDVVEGEKEVRVVAELPGASRQEIVLSVKGNNLVVSAQTGSRKYYKELELPVPVEAKMAKSTFNNGVLEVSLPRKGRSAPH